MSLREGAHNLIDTLQHHPIIGGIMPAGMVGSLTFVEELEIWLRIAGLLAALVVAGLTGYAQSLKIVTEKEKRRRIKEHEERDRH